MAIMLNGIDDNKLLWREILALPLSTFVLSPCRENPCWVYASIIHLDSYNGSLGHVQPLLVSREELHPSTSQDE